MQELQSKYTSVEFAERYHYSGGDLGVTYHQPKPLSGVGAH